MNYIYQHDTSDYEQGAVEEEEEEETNYETDKQIEASGLRTLTRIFNVVAI